MACGCSKNRTAAAAGAAQSGTYRVMVDGRQVYESSSKDAADSVAGKFDKKFTTILAPGQTA